MSQGGGHGVAVDPIDKALWELDEGDLRAVLADAEEMLAQKPTRIPVAVQAAALPDEEARKRFAALLQLGAKRAQRAKESEYPSYWGKLPEAERSKELEKARIALYLVYGRPAVPIRDGQLTVLPKGWDRLAGRARYAIEKATRSVGAIEVKQVNAWKVVGTAFRTAAGKATTAKHVVENVAKMDATAGRQLRDTTRPRARDLLVRFNWRREDGRAAQVFSAVWAADISSDRDVASLSLDDSQAYLDEVGGARKLQSWPLPPPLVWDDVSDHRTDHPCVVLGYPTEVTSLLAAPQFREIFGETQLARKRAMFGKLVPGSDRSDSIVHHDCSTLGGASGGPLLALNPDAESPRKRATVIGVHAGGSFMQTNWATRLRTPGAAEQ